MYPVESDKKLATIYIDLDFEEIEKSFSVFSNDEIECCLFNKNGIIYSSEKENNFLLEDVKKIYGNSNHQGTLKVDGSVWNAYVVKMDDLDWYLVQCMQRKSFVFNSMKNILLFCFGALMVFVFLLVGGDTANQSYYKTYFRIFGCFKPGNFTQKTKTTAYSIRRGCTKRNFHNGKRLQRSCIPY